jgi:hypothetical protein
VPGKDFRPARSAIVTTAERRGTLFVTTAERRGTLFVTTAERRGTLFVTTAERRGTLPCSLLFSRIKKLGKSIRSVR